MRESADRYDPCSLGKESMLDESCSSDGERFGLANLEAGC